MRSEHPSGTNQLLLSSEECQCPVILQHLHKCQAVRDIDIGEICSTKDRQRMSVCIFVRLSVCLSVSMSVRLLVC